MNKNKETIDVAVLLMLFNRASTTRKVFEKIREIKPSKLFIAANGPRQTHPDDVRLCQEVRDIFKDIDWECEVHTNYQDVNRNMHNQWWMVMDWFFEHVESGIILEDDCVPHISFFNYCIDLLERYKDNDQIMHINGSNFQFGKKRGDASYYFSRYPHVWGWATWKRAWKKYDYSMKSFPEFEKNNIVDNIFNNLKERKYWLNFLKRAYQNVFPTADVRWSYTIWSNRGICITPNTNMISNIGFGVDAGHTFLKGKIMDQKTFDIGSVVHPTAIENNEQADLYTFKKIYNKTILQKIIYVSAMKVIKLFRK